MGYNCKLLIELARTRSGGVRLLLPAQREGTLGASRSTEHSLRSLEN